MIPEVNPYNNYRGDGVATLFDYDFFIQNGSQLIVEHIDENDVVTRLEENIDYEIVVIEEEFAGYIKFPIEDSKFGILQENETLSLQLTLPFEQISEYGQSSLLDLNSIEFSLDYLTRLCQILKRQMERSVKVNEGSEANPTELLETINNNAIVSTNAAALASQKADEAMESANVASDKVEEIDGKIVGFNESFEEMVDEIENTTETGKQELNKIKDEAQSFKEELIQNGMFKFQLFDTKTTDRILSYEETFGWALQGTYVYSTAVAGERYGYPDFIERCKKEKSEATATSVTLGSNTLTIYKHSNGHQFYDIADKSKIDTFYNSNGIANFYGIDEENERVFLPRNLANTYFRTEQKGQTFIAPDYTKSKSLTSGSEAPENGWIVTTLVCNSGYPSVSINGVKVGYCGPSANTEAPFGAYVVKKGDVITGATVTFFPTEAVVVAEKETCYFYYCVGNTKTDTSWVDVVTQVEGGVKDLEDKRVQALNDLNNKENTGLSALANASNALRTTQITNCITEIPQRIKYTLENGTLTIKAGSVAIVPYSVEDLTAQYPIGATFLHENFKVYDTQFEDGKFFVWVKIQSDIVSNFSWTGTYSNNFTYIDINKNELFFKRIGFSLSGNTLSGSFEGLTACYNTTSNTVKEHQADGVVARETSSLPLLTFNNQASVITSINQVFNGMGYIGSTIWVDKGVKCLIPNRRNEDGALNNKEIITKCNVLTFTGNYADTFRLVVGLNGKLGGTATNIYSTIKTFSEAPTPQVNKWYAVYVEDENLEYFSSNGGEYALTQYADIAVYITREDSQITSFQPKQPFRAVDYSDKSEVSGWGMPSNKIVNLTLGASGTVYTAPANGWYKLAGTATANGQMVNIVCNNSNLAITSFGFSGGNLDVFVPVKKGEQVTIWYTVASNARFYFVYAEGDK